MSGEMITITLMEYHRLKKQVSWLECLEDAGVDNWEGIEEAIDIHRERFGDEEEADE